MYLHVVCVCLSTPHAIMRVCVFVCTVRCLARGSKILLHVYPLGGHHPSDPTGMSVPDGVAEPGLTGTVP